MDEQELLKMLRAAFKEEAAERLESLSNCLLQLERLAADDVAASEPLEVAFREAHSLKGASRSVSLQDIEVLCQHLESVLAQMKSGKLVLQIHHFDVLHECVATMEQFLVDFSTDDNASCLDKVTVLVEQLDAIAAGTAIEVDSVAGTSIVTDESDEVIADVITIDDSPPVVSNVSNATVSACESQPEPVSVAPSAAKSASSPVGLATQLADPAVAPVAEDAILRVASSRLDAVRYRAEEMIALKQASRQRELEVQLLCRLQPNWKKRWHKGQQQLRAQQKRLESLSDEECRETLTQLFDYVEQAQQQFKTIDHALIDLRNHLTKDVKSVGSMVDELLDDVMSIIMVPFTNAAASMPRMVRDIARTQGKQVDLIISGEDIELDKRILEKLGSPLTHLLRNAIDHGIETPQQRDKAGKDCTAQVKIDLSRLKSGKVEIRICDDGSGIDAQQLRDKAVAQELLTAEQAAALPDDEAIALIFSSGLSTSNILTEISGRGLGMAIVKQEVERLGGHIHTETKLGSGTCFKLHLPVSLSVFRGILVDVRGQRFVLATTAVERVVKVERSAVKTAENRALITVDGQNLAILELGELLSIAQRPITHSDYLQIVVVGNGEQRVGFIVDEVDGEYELLVKGLGHQLQGLRFFSGASVLGDGSIVPILDQGDLLDALKDGRSFTLQSSDDGKQKSILAVDDSITSRMLIKNILEASGYNVVSAVDGADAYAKVTAAPFDLVVSDVEMPKMNGFELTTQIRATDGVADIPVILVTSLESVADKEKGVIAGANAYIVKRSFDQTNLLDTVARLI